MRKAAERSDSRFGVFDGVACDHCGWELRDSDHYCSFCGRQQRRLAVQPDVLSLSSPSEAGDGSEPEPLSLGRVTLSNVGKHSFRLLAVEAPSAIEIDAPLPPASAGGLELPVRGAFALAGRRAGELGAEPLSISVRTSIGTLRLPVRSKAAPPLRLSQRAFQVPRGQEMDVDFEISLTEGAEWLHLKARGPGLELAAPQKRFRLQAGVPHMVTVRADAARCVLPPEPSEPWGLVVHLDDGAIFFFPLTFEEATPGRLLLVGGERYILLRVFPGESVRRVITLRNDGRLSYPIEAASLTTDAGGEFPGVSYKLLDHLAQSLSLPYDVPPGEVIQVRIDCTGEPPPGAKRTGTLRLEAPDVEPYLLPFLLDSREPRAHRLPLAFDFGTSASAVATRHQQRRPGQVSSIEFRPPDDEKSETLLPSDVQIVRHPETGEPAYEIDWGRFKEERHLGLARNLKRRIGLGPDNPESFEYVVIGGRLVEIPVEDLAAFVIREMKRQTEHQLGERLTRVVATFPTRFSLRRVQALREVYEKAELPDVILIDEAVAAGVLGMHNEEFKDKPEYTLLVYDMGGGTTDVTLFRVVNHRIGSRLEIQTTVLAVGGDVNLGGRDITEMMMQRVLDNLPSEERDAIPWPGKEIEAPELQKLAKRNQNKLFTEVEDLKLKLFPLATESVPISVEYHPSLWNREGKLAGPLKSISFTSTEVEEAFQPRLERLWITILDMLRSSDIESLDYLYLAGRSSLFPPVRTGLLNWLISEGEFPRLQRVFAQDRYGTVALKEAVSLGASLALDLLEGAGNEKLFVRGGRSASRFGIRGHLGEFLEILPTNWEIGKPSSIRQPIWLGTPYRSDLYEVRLEVWENPTHSPHVDDNPEAELVGIGHLTYPADEIGPSEPLTEVGLVLHENRTLKLQSWRSGEVKEVPVEP